MGTENLAPADVALANVVEGLKSLQEERTAFLLSCTERTAYIGQHCLEYLKIKSSDALQADSKADLADVREKGTAFIQATIRKSGLADERSKAGKLIKADYNVTRAIKVFCLTALNADTLQLGISHLEKLARFVKADWRDGGFPAWSKEENAQLVRRLVKDAIAKRWTAVRLSLEVSKATAATLTVEEEKEALRRQKEREQNARAEFLDAIDGDEFVAYLQADGDRMERFAALLARASKADKGKGKGAA